MKVIDKIQEIKAVDLAYEPKILVMEALDLKLDELYHILHTELTQDQIQRIDTCVEAVQKRIPISRMTGRKYFWKDLFELSPYTLDPRAETETIIEIATQQCKPSSILDLGTGTGCILLSLLREFPEAHGIGVDISTGALKTARQNAEKLGINKVDFICSNWYGKVQGKFDLIVSNPPYIKTGCEYEALFDPPVSLWDCSAYEHIISSKYLNENGKIIIEVPKYLLKELLLILEKNNMRIMSQTELGEIHFICVGC